MVKKKKTKEDTAAAEEEAIIKKEVPAYKYSAKGTSALYEAIIVQGEPYFITWSETKDQFTSKPQIEEATRIIRPPSAEEYPYTPYEFVDVAELNEYFSRAKDVSKDELYSTIKIIVPSKICRPRQECNSNSGCRQYLYLFPRSLCNYPLSRRNWRK